MTLEELHAKAREAVASRYPGIAAIDMHTIALPDLLRAAQALSRANGHESTALHQRQAASGAPGTNWPVTALVQQLLALADMLLGPVTGPDAEAEPERWRDRLSYELTVALRIAFIIETERAKLDAPKLLVASTSGLDTLSTHLPGGRR